MAAGAVDHAIRLTASRTDRSFLWPARHQAGAASDPSLPPMGAWFRLKAGFDISRFRPDTQVVLRAMQRHGLVLADNGSNWYFTGTSEPGWDTGLLDQLKTIPAGAFEAVDTSSLMADPNSGRVASSSPPPDDRPHRRPPTTSTTRPRPTTTTTARPKPTTTTAQPATTTTTASPRASATTTAPAPEPVDHDHRSRGRPRRRPAPRRTRPASPPNTAMVARDPHGAGSGGGRDRRPRVGAAGRRRKKATIGAKVEEGFDRHRG